MEKNIKIRDRFQLVEYFLKGEVPDSEVKIGIESEFFLVDKKTLKLISFYGARGIEEILKEMVNKYKWQPVLENEHIIGLKRNTTNITMEPAGQLELSGTPCKYLSECEEEYNSFLFELKSICDPLEIGILPIGYHPLETIDNVNWVPKGRYKVLSKYFLDFGQHLAHHMMKLTTTVQACIDYTSEEDFREKMLLASYLVPILYAIYGNSPIKKNDFSGFLSYRGHIWDYTDKKRCGIIPEVFKDNFSYDDYVEYLLNVPMVLRNENDLVIPMHGRSFLEYIKEGNATMADWDLHATLAFPEIRVKKFIEIRSCDSQRPEITLTIPALVKGIFYSKKASQKVLKIFEGVTFEEVVSLKKEVVKKGLSAKFKNSLVLDIAQEIYKIAFDGLKKIGFEGKIAEEDEYKYLKPLYDLLFVKKSSPAEEVLKIWEENEKDVLNFRETLLL